MVVVADAVDSLVASSAEPKTDIHLVMQRRGLDGLLTVRYPWYERYLTREKYDGDGAAGRTRFYTTSRLD